MTNQPLTFSFRRMAALASTTVAEAIRDRILYGLLLFGIGLILLSAVLSNVNLGWSVRIVTNFSFTGVTAAGAMMSVLLGVSAIGRELERRTSYPILAKPIHRAEYVVGKYLGVLLTVYLNVSLMLVAATVMIALYSHSGFFQYDWGSYGAALSLLYLRLAVISALAVTFSTMASTTVAVVAAGGLSIAGYFTSQLRHFLGLSESAATRLLGDILYWVLPDFSILDALARLLHGHPILTTQTAIAAAYAVCYAASLLIIASMVFTRRDLA